MGIYTRIGMIGLVWSLLLGSVNASAQDTATAFSTAQLEQIVAPIALYPDSLLTQVMMASTYPLEVVEADRWMKKNASLKGAELDAALKEQDWDASVKSLCLLPDVLTKMSENLDWTQDLGDAFLSQKTELMDTVQKMRGKAYDEGNLKTTEQMVVTQEPDKIIVIESPSPQVVYVPSYSPTVVYGSAWAYPTYYYPPMYYPPAAGYGLLAFGAGMAMGAAIWGDCNWGWGNGDIDIDVNRYNEFNRNTNINGDRNKINADRGGNRANWQHNPSHRKGVNYRDQGVAQQYGARGGSNRVSREQSRGFSEERITGRGQGRDGASGSGARASGAGQMDRSQSANRAGASTGQMDRSRNTSAGQSTRNSAATSNRNSAFSGSRNAGFDRAASSRGSMSRGSSSFGGGARAGGGRRR
jgi:hypothetical protein